MVDEKYRTFWPRLGASIVDGFVFFLVFIAYLVFWKIDMPVFIRACGFLLYWFAQVTYSIGFHARFGQTLGKMATKVKVLDISERKLTLRQAVLRDSIPLLLVVIGVVQNFPAVLAGDDPFAHQASVKWDLNTTLQLIGGFGWTLAEIITMVTNSKRRAIHDFIARSIVVRIPEPSEHPEVLAA